MPLRRVIRFLGDLRARVLATGRIRFVARGPKLNRHFANSLNPSLASSRIQAADLSGYVASSRPFTPFNAFIGSNSYVTGGNCRCTRWRCVLDSHRAVRVAPEMGFVRRMDQCSSSNKQPRLRR